MFKRIAAATATVALALGLSLVAIAPANADEAPATDTTTTTDTPPVADPPVADPPASDPPASDPPASDPPASDPPASDPPASDPPASDPPASDPPAGGSGPLTFSLFSAAPVDGGDDVKIFPNNPDSFETPGTEEVCSKIDLDKSSVSWTEFTDLPVGATLTKVVIKAGNVADGGGPEDHGYYIDAQYAYPQPTGAWTGLISWTQVANLNTTYTFTDDNDKARTLSHAIYCWIPGGEVGGEVTPAATPTGQTCDSDLENTHLVSGFITLSDVGHISYTITKDSDSSTYGYDASGKSDDLAPGAYTVVATAIAPSTLSALPKDGIIHVTVDLFDGPCSQEHTDASVIPLAAKDPGCSANGSYTLSNSLGNPAAVIWTVNGSIVAEGTYKVKAPATVTVHAAANGPTYGLDGTPQVDWTLTFADPASCGDLKTLALTGTDDGLPMLAASGLLLLLGIALVRSGLRIRRQSAAS